MSLQTWTLKNDETGRPLHIQQAEQMRAYREAWKEAGHTRQPRVSVSASIFALVNDQDRMYFGRGTQTDDTIGFPDDEVRKISGRNYAAEPDVLIAELAKDEAIAAADTLLPTAPNQLGTDCFAHLIESIRTHVASHLDWR